MRLHDKVNNDHTMLLKHVRVVFLILFVPILSQGQSDDHYRPFLINFQRCSKLKVDDKAYKENAIVFFEAFKKKDSIQLTRLVGKHKKEVYLILRNTFNCMDLSKIENGTYRCLYVIEEHLRDHRKMKQMNENREKKLARFIADHELPEDVKRIVIGFGHPIR